MKKSHSIKLETTRNHFQQNLLLYIQAKTESKMLYSICVFNGDKQMLLLNCFKLCLKIHVLRSQLSCHLK